MANLNVKDGSGTSKYLSATGAGSDGDPYVPTHAISGTVTADPAAKTLVYVTGTKAASGDNELIAAPAAGTRIVVSSFVVQNESSTATTMILKDGSTNKWRNLGQNQGDGLAMVFPVGREWKLTAATALNLNLSGANSCGYNVAYWTEAA